MIPFDVVFTKLCYKINASPENLSFLRSFNDPNEVKYLTHDQVLKQIIDLRHFKMSIEPFLVLLHGKNFLSSRR